MGKEINITRTQLLADIFDAQKPIRDEQYVDTHPDSRGLKKQGAKGPSRPYVFAGQK